MSSQSKTPGKSSSNRQGALAGGRHITRNRASYSCHTCRRRKVKCDKAHPICGNCLKNGTECNYDTAAPKKGDTDEGDEFSQHGVKRRRGMSQVLKDEDAGAQPFSNGRGVLDLRGGSAIEARLDKLTNMIERLSKANDSVPIQEMSRQLQSMNPDVDLRALSKPATSATTGPTPKKTAVSRAASPRRTADSSGDEFPIPSGNAMDPVDPIGSLNLGHLSLEDGRSSRYVGTTYWAYISDEINELNQLLRDQNRTHDDSLLDESSNDDVTTDAAVKSPRAKVSPQYAAYYQHQRRSSLRRDHFHRAILFPTGDSPTGYDKVVETHMLEDLPSRRQSDILYRGFMSGVHAISPVLHPPTVLKLYSAFWDWYDHGHYSGDQCPDPSFIPLLYTIWYGGSVTISLRTIKAEFPNVSSRSTLSEMFHDQVTIWLTKISFPRNPTLHGLVAFLLVQTILSREEQPLASSLFISMALRVAQTMGLHRDPAQFGIQSSDAEARRRIWWHIVHMDGVVAMSSGLPPLVNDENFWDVRETSEVKDTLLGTPQAEQYSKLVANNLRPRDNPDDPTVCGGKSMVNVFYLCARGKYIMARAIRKILKIQLGTKPITGSDMEELRSILIDLQFQLNSLVNRIPLAHHPNTTSQDNNTTPSDLSASISPGGSLTGEGALPADGPNSCSEQYHTPVLVAFHKWARILLSLFIDKAFCVAYQPFLKNAKSRVWPAARQGALRHCHGFMEKFIALATDTDFQPFQWSWPGNHQPMHATMIMLIDLYERPNTPQALRSRAFIDKIFSISGPDGGVVGGEDGVTTARPLKDGGKEAWDLMRRLREKAWQKAGLDPQQLWTEQAQIRAGITTQDGTPSPYMNRPGFISMRGKPDTYLGEFANRFYEMTRAQTLPNPVVSSLRQEIPRLSPAAPKLHGEPLNQQQTQQYIQPSPPSSNLPTVLPQQQSLDATLTLANLATETVSTPSPSRTLFHTHHIPMNHPSHPSHPFPTGSPSLNSPANFAIDTPPSTSPPSVAAAPTPPSMMDPNLNFDWDQWDAVFGQQLPVADELMELDPVAGLGLPDLGLGLGSNDGSGNMWPDLRL
ncbi:hypothetical protein BGW36DRAFT_293602 [Talaromyces proteolyticus]|uniref:Zn(2)-C6 fungal-type domain-containing protein n=1 Tax=Talaromyces proteolyticus TaxID=1131652 RepID=A0AAD4KUQ3_9EURO|nr:uncharacterized protein BGW36DRAFT_293602 [Talaromyces proteolyticus]KAH8699175.1 hypothetical protein BGW36DRAFT_293602 [Talaromyces proteolyticus]